MHSGETLSSTPEFLQELVHKMTFIRLMEVRRVFQTVEMSISY